MRGGPDQADRAERAVRDPVRGADEREVVEAAVRELVADADERPARVERLGEHVEQRRRRSSRSISERYDADLLVADVVEQPGGSADEDALLLVLGPP